MKKNPMTIQPLPGHPPEGLPEGDIPEWKRYVQEHNKRLRRLRREAEGDNLEYTE